ncbi:UNVERIFIED_ORG: DeoR/GlpR family transcriptional regulator of sugar metabolism [Rhizobium sp. SORGH_AS260]|jgi:DeoR/GlpR family transcriptional regulator of sugar metabolism|uniref:DeoR/GlpR family DNA-binding transcription regulator n=1 Tax=Agrobacterium TaxID=357 RepID=UPI000D3404BB|nr:MULTISPECIES: DeoR/GlpR family DNA-binding transcription regulator [Agrobacterium]MDP9734345.1 DeoR/GlpR family transcriptional regulator of sugar metabolism [Rhizobium sp. SORGH_AS_0285]MDP9756525.1 DeoR/GlpR family transcriptional regulator of sugar metabolism [Rhizobium sp. SORGH_AS_0260]MCJ2876927.1 DeoR/GlpR transcriptional regulator [Agrobacterium pusense]MDR6083530.1 DeoR/GlpR family transcriptional regulator of sugar metabolism [Agrobacterium sp. SORGH_AS_0440]PTV72829.1 DeoR family
MSDHFVSERQALILEQLRQNGRVLAQDLAQNFGVSEDTVRRDLREMAARGECMRVYGGALLSDSKTVPLKTRIAEDADRKALLARAVVPLLKRGMVVFIDAGSTNLAIARAIPAGLNVTVVTNTPAIAAELTGRADIDLVLIGGKVDPAVGAAIDAMALRQLELMRPDLCVLGVCGVAVETGLSADVFEDAVFKRLACSASQRIVAAITTEKLGHKAAFQVHDFSPPLSLVLERDADRVLVEGVSSRGVDVYCGDDAVA